MRARDVIPDAVGNNPWLVIWFAICAFALIAYVLAAYL